MTDIESLKLSIEEHLNRAVLATDSTKAMQSAYEAKELVQRFYYAIWHSHYTSGVVKK